MITVVEKLQELNELMKDAHNRYKVDDTRKYLIAELLSRLDNDEGVAALQETIDHCFPMPREIVSIPSRIMGIKSNAYVMKGRSYEKKSVA